MEGKKGGKNSTSEDQNCLAPVVPQQRREQNKTPSLIEGVDFTWDQSGLMVLTAAYLKKRGYCCQSGCRNCPYGFKKK